MTLELFTCSSLILFMKCDPIAHPNFVDSENECFPSDTRLAYT